MESQQCQIRSIPVRNVCDDNGRAEGEQDLKKKKKKAAGKIKEPLDSPPGDRSSQMFSSPQLSLSLYQTHFVFLL